MSDKLDDEEITTTMKREEWISEIVLSSIPLRQLGKNNMPINAASGCLVDYCGKRLILSVSHATGNMGRWAIELKYVPGKGTRLYQVGSMNYLKEGNLSTGILKDVDFSYAIVPNDLVAYYQELEPNELIKTQTEKLVLTLDPLVTPEKSQSYGFSGHTMLTIESWFLCSEYRVVLDLSYVGEDKEYYLFKLPFENPGDQYFKGCSGAPIIDTEGNAVALVCGRLPDDPNIIQGISLQKYKVALDIEVGNITY